MHLLCKSLLAIIPFLFTDAATTKTAQPVTVEGVVINSSNNKPVGNTYLYIVAGEEEALTDGNGKFVITTWQSFPLSITAEHPNYKKVKLQVSKAGAKQLIRLNTR